LAAANPQARLPCPLCASGVRGASLEDHLTKVHGGELLEGRQDFSWMGRSGRVPSWALVVLAIALGWVIAGVVAHTVVAEQTVLIGVGLGALALGLVAVSACGLLPAKMTYDGESLRVRAFLGLVRKVVPLSAALEIGSIWEKQGATSDGGASWWSAEGERWKGRYLQIRGPNATITVMARKAPLGEYWRTDELKGGPMRYWSDIRISSEGFVALEYVLASHGMLSLRNEGGTARSRTW
jgi:hypothetical protein